MSIGRRLAAVFLLLSACQQPDGPMVTDWALRTLALHRAATVPRAPSTSLPNEQRSCAVELGRAAAQRLANRCRAVSPATHPPCHRSNSCALIEEEIARGCSMLGADAVGRGCGVLASEDGRAIAVIRRYYSAINARDFATAYQQWGNDGQASGKSFEAFRDGFAATRSVRVTIGSVGIIEGGAGSLYLDIPLRIEATLVNGTRQTFVGDYVVRRVNDVDGADGQARQWHIMSGRLRAER